jgi:hypothetical protein
MMVALIAMLALSGIPPAAEEPEKLQDYKNTIRWTTASEVDSFGFDVYRATKEDGPFECLNESPIEGAGTTDVPQKYAFVDDTIDPDQEYFYYVESISMSGERERFTPVYRAPPKRKSED